MYLSEVLRYLCFRNIATRLTDKFENTVKSCVRLLGIDLSFGCRFFYVQTEVRLYREPGSK